MFRDSLGGAENQSTLKSRRKNSVKEKKLDFEKSLDPDAEQNSTPSRKKSRRVSSMLARADLSMSASHDRGGGLFAEYHSSQHPITRTKSNSNASQAGRASFAGYTKTFRNSLSAHPLGQSTNSFLETPIDNLLDGLKAGGDFEGFGGMDLEDEDYEGMRKEVVFTKIDSIPIKNDNVHFSSSSKPASDQCRVSIIPGPKDTPGKSQIVVCIHDHQEKKLVVATLSVYKTMGSNSSQAKGRRQEIDKKGRETIKIVPKDILHAEHVVAACKLQDGNITRILVLTESQDGSRALSLQSPWGVLMNVPYPTTFLSNNLRSICFDAHRHGSRQAVAARLVSDPPSTFKALESPLLGGLIDLVDTQNRSHQLHIQMEPRVPLVKRTIDTCRYIATGRLGDCFLVGWWNVQKWLQLENPSAEGTEYSALVIMLFTLVLQYQDSRSIPIRTKHERKRSSFSKSSSTVPGAASNLNHLLDLESENGNPIASWAQTSGWKWLDEENGRPATPIEPRCDTHDFSGGSSFIQRHVLMAQDFLKSSFGHAANEIKGLMPGGDKPATSDSLEVFLTKIIRALHFLHEDDKLDITLVDSLAIGNPSLAPVLSQMCRWIGWKNWAEAYDMEFAAMDTIVYDTSRSFLLKTHDLLNNLVKAKILAIQEPVDIPNIHAWIGSGLVGNDTTVFCSLTDVKYGKHGVHTSGLELEEQCSLLTPRTALFKRLDRKSVV